MNDQSPDTLLGVAEVADLLGLSRQRVTAMDKSHARFPKPIVRLACGPIWHLGDIEEFAKLDRPNGGPRRNQ